MTTEAIFYSAPEEGSGRGKLKELVWTLNWFYRIPRDSVQVQENLLTQEPLGEPDSESPTLESDRLLNTFKHRERIK